MVNLGLLLNEKLWQSELLAYDRLLMPPEFWSAKRPGKSRPRTWVPERPPSQVHLTVFYGMAHVWNAFFIPAVSLALGAPLLWYRARRPRLGPND